MKEPTIRGAIMLSKVKRVFFPAIFGVLYALFAAQLVFSIINIVSGGLILNSVASFEICMLLVEWLALIAARYLSKKSASQQGGHHSYRR
jgi:hypothetical protein